MTLRLTVISFYLLILFFPSLLFAQNIKFKPPTKKEMNISEYTNSYFDAEAVILDKKGQFYFDVSSKNGIVYHYHEGQRIVILEDEGKEIANIKITYYSPKSNNNISERIYNISGTTYNLENGNIQKIKLEKSNIYHNRLNDNWMEVSFAMPNVKQGSLIEYSYSKESGYVFNLQPWYIQMDYPVLNSELNTIIPEYFEFQERVTGNLFKIDRQEKRSSALIGGVSHNAKSVYYKAENIPPVEDEPFVSNKCDLPMRLNFYMIAVRFPYSPVQHIAGTIGKLNSRLLEIEDFWRAAMRGNFPNEVMDKARGLKGKEKAEFLFNWIKENMAWDGTYSIFREGTLRECLRNKKGSVADVNLSLNALFRENGFEAYPVILSSRGNGVPHPIYTDIGDFNYVISMVKIDDENYLCDATSHTVMGLLPTRCLNYSGYLITESGGQNIKLSDVGKDMSTGMCHFSFEDNRIIVDISSYHSEYAAYNIWEDYYKEGKENYIKNLESRYTDWEFQDYTFEEKESNIIEKFQLVQEHSFEDIIYFQPFMYVLFKESPFKRDTRYSVVDFPYGIRNRMTVKIDLPEGYELEGIPEKVNLLMTKKAANFMLLSAQEGNSVTLTFNLTIDKLTYSPQEYPELKAFFDMIAEIANTTLVLKKKI